MTESIMLRAGDPARLAAFYAAIGMGFTAPDRTEPEVFEQYVPVMFRIGEEDDDRFVGIPIVEATTLEKFEGKVVALGGTIIAASSPSKQGRRTLFEDPEGNRFAAEQVLRPRIRASVRDRGLRTVFEHHVQLHRDTILLIVERAGGRHPRFAGPDAAGTPDVKQLLPTVMTVVVDPLEADSEVDLAAIAEGVSPLLMNVQINAVVAQDLPEEIRHRVERTGWDV